MRLLNNLPQKVLHNNYIFFEDLLAHIMSGPKLYIAPTAQVCTSAIRYHSAASKLDM
jgi:hypothetical protein